MPPKLRHQHNEVEEVAAKFPQYKSHFSEDVIQKTNQELRVLAAKAPIGTLDEKHDHRDLRAAILLECVVRETTGARLVHKVLAKGLCRKIDKFNKLHNTIANLRKSPDTGNGSISRAKNNNNSKFSNRPSSLQPTSARNSESSQPENTIPRLSLRLNSLIQDPHGFAMKAQKLMKDVSSYVDTLSRTAKRRGEREDIDSHKSAYEAACFFHVVNTAQPKTTTRTKQQLSNAKQQGNADAYSGRSLELEDILNVCPELTEIQFKHILKHLDKLAAEVKEANSRTKANQAPAETTQKAGADPKKSRTKKSEGRKRKGNSISGDGASSKKSKAVVDNEEEENATTTTKRNDHRRCRDDQPEISSLDAWRQQTLADAKRSAKEQLHKATGKSLPTISDSEALQYAADEILQKFGLEIVST